MVNITELDISHPMLVEYARKHGKRVISAHGQRIFHNPDEPRPPRGTQIFVGRLPRNVYEDTLVPLFTQVGDIYELRLMMEFSGYTRGFCFITYYNEAVAQDAIRRYHTHYLNGSAICVYKSWDNTRLYIHGMPDEVTKEEILEEFKKRFVGVVNVFCMPYNGAPHRGWAFVEFDCHHNACSARKQMWPSHLQLWNRKIKIEWAKPKRRQHMRNASTVAMMNIDEKMTSENIYLLIREHVKNNALLSISHRHGTNQAKLEFNTPNNAAFACSKLNGVVVNGKPIKMQQRGLITMHPRNLYIENTEENATSVQLENDNTAFQSEEDSNENKQVAIWDNKDSTIDDEVEHQVGFFPEQSRYFTSFATNNIFFNYYGQPLQPTMPLINDPGSFGPGGFVVFHGDIENIYLQAPNNFWYM